MSQRHFQTSPIRCESTWRGNVHVDVESVEWERSERLLSGYSVFVLHMCSCKLRNEKCVLWFCFVQVREVVRSTRSESANNPTSRTNVSNSKNVSAKPQKRSKRTVQLYFSLVTALLWKKPAYLGLENIMVWIEIPVFVATSTRNAVHVCSSS